MSPDSGIQHELRRHAARINPDVSAALAEVIRRGQRRRRLRRASRGITAALLIGAAAVAVPRLASDDAIRLPLSGEGNNASPTPAAGTPPTRNNPLVVLSGVKDGNRWQLVAYSGDACREHGLPEQGTSINVELREFRDSGWEGSGGGWCDVPDERALGEPVIHRGAVWGVAAKRVATVRVEVLDHTPIDVETIKVAIGSRPFAIYFSQLPPSAHVVKLIAFDAGGHELEHQEFPPDGPPADYTDPPRPSPTRSPS